MATHFIFLLSWRKRPSSFGQQSGPIRFSSNIRYRTVSSSSDGLIPRLAVGQLISGTPPLKYPSAGRESTSSTLGNSSRHGSSAYYSIAASLIKIERNSQDEFPTFNEYAWIFGDQDKRVLDSRALNISTRLQDGAQNKRGLIQISLDSRRASVWIWNLESGLSPVGPTIQEIDHYAQTACGVVCMWRAGDFH
jgi:hypothetical protein